MILRGRVWKFGDGVHTHFFLSGKYDPVVRAGKYAELVPHLLEDVDPGFVNRVREDDLLVAGRAFGGGKHVRGLIGAFKVLKIGGILARSFSAEWERACINAGLPALVYDGLHSNVDAGDELELDTSAEEAKNVTRGRTFRVAPISDGIVAILEAGGLDGYMKRRLRLTAGAGQ